MKKFLAMFFAMIILLAGCSNNEPPVEVKAQKVLSANGALTLNHSGTIALSDAKEIRAAISGNILEKFAEDGADVTEGQVLFKIGELEGHTELLQAKADLTKARTDLARALAAKDPSAAELQRTADEQQEFVNQLEDAAKSGMVVAPKAGRLNSSDAPLGMSVTADETVLGTVGNINPVSVRFTVSPQEAHMLKTAENLSARLKLNDGTTYHDGTIIVDDDAAEIFFDNPDELLTPGTPAQIELDGAKVANVLLVPEKAIQRRGDGDFVFAVDSDKEAAVKKISLGDKLGTYFIVKDGLKSDDLVVVEGMTALREGTPLKFRD